MSAIPQFRSPASGAKKISRRSFLGLAFAGGIGLLVAEWLVAVLNFLRPVSTGGFGGPFDPKTSNNGVFADAAAFNKKVKVLFLGIGSMEGPRTKNFSEALTKAGIHNVYFESPGTAHEWLTWRRCLNDFAPRLFR